MEGATATLADGEADDFFIVPDLTGGPADGISSEITGTAGIPPEIGVTHFQEVAFVFNNVHGLGYAINPFLGKPQSYVSKCESGERRVDVVELMEFAAVYGRSVTAFLPTSKKRKRVGS